MEANYALHWSLNPGCTPAAICYTAMSYAPICYTHPRCFLQLKRSRWSMTLAFAKCFCFSSPHECLRADLSPLLFFYWLSNPLWKVFLIRNLAWKVPVKIWTTGHWTPSSRLEKRTLRYESSLKTVFEIGLLNDLLCTLLYTLCQIRWDRVASACYKISC